MKRITYKKMGQMHEYDVVDGEMVSKDVLIDFELPFSNENEAIAKAEAYNGEYTIEDTPEPEPTPDAPAADDLTADEMAAAIMEGVNAV